MSKTPEEQAAQSQKKEKQRHTGQKNTHPKKKTNCKDKVKRNQRPKPHQVSTKIKAKLPYTRTPTNWSHQPETIKGKLGMNTPNDRLSQNHPKRETHENLKIVPTPKKDANRTNPITKKQNSNRTKNAEPPTQQHTANETTTNNTATTKYNTKKTTIPNDSPSNKIKQRKRRTNHFQPDNTHGSIPQQPLTRVPDDTQQDETALKLHTTKKTLTQHNTTRNHRKIIRQDTQARRTHTINDGKMRSLKKKQHAITAHKANKMTTPKPKTLTQNNTSIKAEKKKQNNPETT
ncbi:hypothetical protein [Escherichia coli]|uniref:hypothetical protein n=1 Tax=Escherichia coli TaxID=562 RepID=UPI0006509075|nr:hypothetical protein [Escherichia coli]